MSYYSSGVEQRQAMDVFVSLHTNSLHQQEHVLVHSFGRVQQDATDGPM